MPKVVLCLQIRHAFPIGARFLHGWKNPDVYCLLKAGHAFSTKGAIGFLAVEFPQVLASTELMVRRKDC